jgi:hypothetical protein
MGKHHPHPSSIYFHHYNSISNPSTSILTNLSSIDNRYILPPSYLEYVTYDPAGHVYGSAARTVLICKLVPNAAATIATPPQTFKLRRIDRLRMDSACLGVAIILSLLKSAHDERIFLAHFWKYSITISVILTILSSHRPTPSSQPDAYANMLLAWSTRATPPASGLL